MHNLAVLYAEGVSGTPDYKSAAIWFRKAADHGLKDSQYNLAVLYARGVGVEQNYAESYKWFVLAANQGDRDSDVKRNEVAAHLDAQMLEAARLAVELWSPEPQPDAAINVKTQAAWETPAETPHPVKPKPRPTWGDTRAADARPN
ncbi:MAG: tetratricopeptide repeat protein [Xanthobacteraceae bacterium]